MEFAPPLQTGWLIKRYKRFLADIRLENGEVVTIHCPNTGSMLNCQEPDSQLWFSTSSNPKRKYPQTWEMVTTATGKAGINTARANALVGEAIKLGVINELQGYSGLSAEVAYGTENSRIDWLLETPEGNKCYVEVKNVTLGQGAVAYFPDAITTRGQKHLRELRQVVADGHRAVLVFCVQLEGVSKVCPAGHIDPVYARGLGEAMAAGVEVLAYQADLSATEIVLRRRLPVELEAC